MQQSNLAMDLTEQGYVPDSVIRMTRRPVRICSTDSYKKCIHHK